MVVTPARKDSTLTHTDVPHYSRRRLIFDLTGFVVGALLLAWIIQQAIQKGDWSRVLEAPPWLLVALVGSTLVSALANGACFWITVRAIKPLRFWDLQALNLVASMLNYAPVRIGALSRFAYHMRVDRMRLLEIIAWFVAIMGMFGVGLAAVIGAIIIYPELNVIWFILLVVGTVSLGLILRALAATPIIMRHGRGAGPILRNHRALWGGIVLRLIDLAAFACRMAAALAILGIDISPTQTLVLAVVAVLANLIPFGRVGFREYAVAIVATQFFSTESLDVPWEMLALFESAGEAAVFIPLGGLLLIWFIPRMAKTRSVEKQTNEAKESV